MHAKEKKRERECVCVCIIIIKLILHTHILKSNITIRLLLKIISSILQLSKFIF